MKETTEILDFKWNNNNRGYRRGQNNRNRGRPFVKYVSRQQIMYDQTCQNEECQTPGAYVHHHDDCPQNKPDQNQNKDFH